MKLLRSAQFFSGVMAFTVVKSIKTKYCIEKKYWCKPGWLNVHLAFFMNV